MSIFSYKTNFSVSDNETVILTVKFPDRGTAGFHSVDLPGSNDQENYNECDFELGTGKFLKTERTVVLSKIGNMDAANTDVKAEYYINGKLVATHSNSKNVDRSPMIKLTIEFQ